MFVYVNVIEDITAYFGVCNMDFFLFNFEHFIVAFATLHDSFVFFFCVFAIYQVYGKLPYQKRNKASKFPFMLCFSVITLYALSNVSHKEERFMSAIFPCFAISSSFFFMKVSNAIRNKTLKVIVMKCFILFWIFKECKQLIPQFRVDKDIYTYLHGRN